MMKNNYSFVFVPRRLSIKLCFACSIQLILKRKQLQLSTRFYQCSQGKVDFDDQLAFRARCSDTQFASVNVILKTRMGQKIAGVVNIVLAGKADQILTVKLQRCPDTSATLQFTIKRQQCDQLLEEEGESQPVLHYIVKRFQISDARSSRLDKSSVSRVSSLSKSSVRQQLKTTSINSVTLVQRKETEDSSLTQLLQRDIEILKSDIQAKRKKYLDEHREHLAHITLMDQQLMKTRLQLQQYRVCVGKTAEILKGNFQFSDQSAPRNQFWETLQLSLSQASLKLKKQQAKISQLESQVKRLSQIILSLQNSKKSSKSDLLLVELKACLASHQETIFKLQSQRLSAEQQAQSQKKQQLLIISQLQQQIKTLKGDIVNKQNECIKQHSLNYNVLRQQFDHVSLQNERLQAHQSSLMLQLNALKALNNNFANPVILETDENNQNSILSPTKLSSLYKLCQQKDTQINELQNFISIMQKEHKIQLQEIQGRLRKCQLCNELSRQLAKNKQTIEQQKTSIASLRRTLASKDQQLEEVISCNLINLKEQKSKYNLLKLQFQMKCREGQHKDQEMEALRQLRKQLEDQLRIYEQTQFQLRARVFELQFKLHSVYISKCEICAIEL